MSRRTSVKWRGREVQHPVGRAAVATTAVVGGAIGVVVAILVLAILVPLSIPLHALLRALGRRGFVERDYDGSFSYELGAHGFQRDPAGSVRPVAVLLVLAVTLALILVLIFG